jgi:hypothetical protein
MTNSIADIDTGARDWIVRTIPAGVVVDISGYGIEVLRVDPADAVGKLYTSKTRDDFEGPFSVDAFMVTTPGARRAGSFRYVKFIAFPSAPNTGSVTVRVFTSPKAVWSEGDPAGKQRTIFWERNIAGGLTLAAGIAQGIVDLYTGNGQTPDLFWTDEQFRAELYWYGFVASTAGAFNVYVATLVNPADPAEVFHVSQLFTPRTPAASAAVLTAFGLSANHQILDFTTGSNISTTSNTASCRQPIPPGPIKMVIENTAAGPNTFFYSVGACANL